jgi:endonuclease III
MVGRAQLGNDIDRLIVARNVLRRHGQVTCRRRAPRCEECVLRTDCGFARARGVNAEEER